MLICCVASCTRLSNDAEPSLIAGTATARRNFVPARIMRHKLVQQACLHQETVNTTMYMYILAKTSCDNTRMHGTNQGFIY